MDQAVVQYYRRLLKEEFPNAGALDHPSVFVEAVGERLIDCGNTGNYMELYLRVLDGRIVDVKYRCACEPVANVAVEILCNLVKGRTLDEALGITEEPFYQLLGSRDERLGRKVRGLLQLLNEGIAGDRCPTGAEEPSEKAGDEQGGKLSWDGKLST
jgi:NifU-like protein involved in Fe-S cluster formation